MSPLALSRFSASGSFGLPAKDGKARADGQPGGLSLPKNKYKKKSRSEERLL